MRLAVQRLDLNLKNKFWHLTNFFLSNHSLSFDWVENTEETQKNNTRKIQNFLKLLIYWSTTKITTQFKNIPAGY